MDREEFTQTVQHVTGYSDHVKMKLMPSRGVLFLRAVKAGTVTRREIIENGEIEFEALHDGVGWYLPLVIKALRLLDDRVEAESEDLPAFLVGRYG